MIEKILSESVSNLILDNILLNNYENCIIKKKCYGFKLNKKEERDFWYILNFKYPMMKLIRRIIEKC